MQTASSTLSDRVLFGLAFALLLALSLPGIEVRAEGDGAAPPARELLGLDAKSVNAPTQAGASCAAQDPSALMAQYARQQEVMRQLALADGPGELKPMNGRGYGYVRQGDPALELLRLQAEARAEARASGGAAN